MYAQRKNYIKNNSIRKKIKYCYESFKSIIINIMRVEIKKNNLENKK